jgi:hypothetical protein
VKLTNPQVSYLSRAFDLVLRFGKSDNCLGVHGNLKNGRRVCSRLEAMGLLKFVGFTSDIDGEREGEHPTWACTEAGAVELIHRGEITEDDVTAWRAGQASKGAAP